MTVKITLGADPEYGLLKAGRIVPPGSVLTTNTEFGVDGCSSIGELRPPHGKTPQELTENIRKVLQGGVSRNPQILEYQVKAGGFVAEFPIGGHIHFGHEGLLEDDNRIKLNKALNRTIAVLTLMVEDQEEAVNRRMGSPYGSTEDRSFHEQNWGVEYRVLPSWLTHPKECEAILAVSYVIASEFHNEEIMDDACSLPGFNTQAFKECDKLQLLYHVPQIVKFIKGLPLYETYEDQIKYLFRMIKNRETWSCNANMLDTWDLRSYAKPMVAKKREAAVV